MQVESPAPAFTPFQLSPPPRLLGSGSYECKSAVNFTPFVCSPRASEGDVASCRASRPRFSDDPFDEQMGAEAEVIAGIENDVDISDDDDDDDERDDEDEGEDSNEEGSDEEEEKRPEERRQRKSRQGHQLNAAAHKAEMETGFSGFKCKACKKDSSATESCLEKFSKQELRAAHDETYGADQPKTERESLQQIHQLYWSMAVPLEEPDFKGRTFKVLQYKIRGKPVCPECFRRGVGGTKKAHKTKLALVLRGIDPSTLSASQEAELLLKVGCARDGSS